MSIKQTPSFETPDKLTRKAIWDLRDKAIQQGFESPEIVLLDALMGTGKSYGIPKWAAQTGNQVTIFAPRHDVLDEYVKRCEEHGLSHKRLASFHRHCESISLNKDGQPEDELTRDLLKKYTRGKSGKEIHKDTNLYPCQEDGPCEYMKRLNINIEKRDGVAIPAECECKADQFRDDYDCKHKVAVVSIGGPILLEAAIEYQSPAVDTEGSEASTGEDLLRADGGTVAKESNRKSHPLDAVEQGECDCADLSGDIPCWICVRSGRRELPK